MRAASDSGTEGQLSQVRSHRAVERIGHGVVPTRDVEQDLEVNARGVTFSHAT